MAILKSIQEEQTEKEVYDAVMLMFQRNEKIFENYLLLKKNANEIDFLFHEIYLKKLISNIKHILSFILNQYFQSLDLSFHDGIDKWDEIDKRLEILLKKLEDPICNIFLPQFFDDKDDSNFCEIVYLLLKINKSILLYKNTLREKNFCPTDDKKRQNKIYFKTKKIMFAKIFQKIRDAINDDKINLNTFLKDYIGEMFGFVSREKVELSFPKLFDPKATLAIGIFSQKFGTTSAGEIHRHKSLIITIANTQ